jgi:hypothetical protein
MGPCALASFLHSGCDFGAALVAPGVVSAAVPEATTLSGYTYVEVDGTIPADGTASVVATCPRGDVVLGGGGYQNIQDTQEGINTSEPASGDEWGVIFNNPTSQSITGVDLAYCAKKSSLKNFTWVYGSDVTVPANSDVQSFAICPSGTVSLGGGWYSYSNTSSVTTDGATSSAPYGTNGWRAWLAAGANGGTSGFAAVVCAKKPAGWAQVSSAYSAVGAESQVAVTVKCPSGTKVLGGGSFDSSLDPLVQIGLTDSFTNEKGWNTAVNNNTTSSVSADAWGVCAKV